MCPSALKKNTKHSSPIISPLYWSFTESEQDLWDLIKESVPSAPKKRSNIPFASSFIDWIRLHHVISPCPCPIFLFSWMGQFCGCFTAQDGAQKEWKKKCLAWKSFMSLLTKLICQQTTQTRLKTHQRKCQWKMWNDYVMEAKFFILEIWLIKVCMFCKFKENLRGRESLSERPRPYLFRKDHNFSSGKCAAYHFSAKNWSRNH